MSDLTLAQWQHKASHLTLPSQAFIDGSYRDAINGATFDCINPANGKLLTKVAACDAADAELAVQAARAAFDDKRWSGLPPKQRKQILQRFAELMRLNKVELALLESLDMGKPIGDAMGYDAPAAANCIAWNAEAIDKIYDQVAPVEESALALVTREPLGVVAAIVPWNFPLVMACWKLGPALATGNSVILKPSEKSPLTALRIAGLAKEAGIPDGVFNVLPGFGNTVGEALAMHMDVDCITFTGSTKIGKHLVQCSGKSNLKRAFMECGGKSPNIILADAPDLDAAAKSAAGAIFTTRARCVPPPPACWCKTASSRSSWTGCWPMPANGSRPTRSTLPPASAPWWTTSRWSKCSTTSPSASRRAPSCCWEASAPIPRAAASTSSPPSSTR